MKSAHSAFTLIEVLIVLDLIVLLLAMSIPMIGSTNTAISLNSAGTDLVHTLTEAQQYAVNHSSTVVVEFLRHRDADRQERRFYTVRLWRYDAEGHRVGLGNFRKLLCWQRATCRSGRRSMTWPLRSRSMLLALSFFPMAEPICPIRLQAQKINGSSPCCTSTMT